MLIVETIPLLRQQIRRWQNEGKRIALVPTMGNLHNGHLALIKEAHKHSDIVVVSIFVNPMQFERADDLASYPRTLQEDCELLKRHNVDLVFAPTPTDIYPQGLENQTYVEVPELSTVLEGKLRPGHFRGVTTVVSKLFNLIQPSVACFGEKDFQQLALINKMTEDMGYDITIIAVPTVRSKDGLALSSRNSYLTKTERKIAPKLSKTMNTLAQLLAEGEKDIPGLIEQATLELKSAGFTPDAIDICDAKTLQPLNAQSHKAVILMAAWLGKARLIDNQLVDINR